MHHQAIHVLHLIARVGRQDFHVVARVAECHCFLPDTLVEWLQKFAVADYPDARHDVRSRAIV